MNEWFSAMLSFVVEVEDEPDVRRSRSLVVLQARHQDFGHATSLALEKGRALQSDHLNSEGKRVTSTLERVETVDALGSEIADGREIYHEFSELFSWAELPDALDPSAAAPYQSGV